MPIIGARAVRCSARRSLLVPARLASSLLPWCWSLSLGAPALALSRRLWWGVVPRRGGPRGARGPSAVAAAGRARVGFPPPPCACPRAGVLCAVSAYHGYSASFFWLPAAFFYPRCALRSLRSLGVPIVCICLRLGFSTPRRQNPRKNDGAGFAWYGFRRCGAVAATLLFALCHHLI